MKQLEDVAAELAVPVDVAQVLDALRYSCLSLFGGTGGYFVLVDWDTRTVGAVTVFGEPVRSSPIRAGASTDIPHPWIQSLLSGTPIFTSAESGSTAVLPLPCQEQAYMLLVLEAPAALASDGDEQSFLLSVCRLGGQALDRGVTRTRLLQAQQRLEEQAQEAQTLNAELRGYTLALARNVGEPVRRIRDFLRLVELRLASTLDARTRELFAFARLEADQLGDRVGELRTLALIDSRELKFERVDLNQLLVQVRHDLEPLTQGRRVQWQVSSLPVVEADALLLWQVMVELLGFLLDDTIGQPSPVIWIEGQKMSGYLQLQFWDQGRGFDPDLAERMFEVLDRSIPRVSALAQLGMSNVRRVVNRHGGRVWAESRPGEGTRFFVLLPRTHDAAEEAAP